MRAHPERAGCHVRVVAHSDLVIDQLFSEGSGLVGFGQKDPPGLNNGLEPAD